MLSVFLIRQILDHIRARHTAAIKHKMNTLGTIQVAQARQVSANGHPYGTPSKCWTMLRTVGVRFFQSHR